MVTLNLCTAIITAAGSGSRMGGEIKKQFRLLEGIPIIIRTLEPFFASPLVTNMIVTAPEEDVEYCKDVILEFFEPAEKPFLVIAGGIERQDSVFGALQCCPKGTEVVFIHDAVRPFINLEMLESLYNIALECKAVVPASRLKNTVKTIERDYISSTLVRDRLIQVFTPQVFDYTLIMKAYSKAYNDGYVSTDDAALVEHYGQKIRYLLTNDLNIKITDEFDLTLARMIVSQNIVF